MSNDVPLEWKLLWLEKRLASQRACVEANRAFAAQGLTTPDAVRKSERELLTCEAIMRDYDAQRVEGGLKGRGSING